MMKKLFEILLPARADNTIRGSNIPLYLLMLVAFIGVVRSCIHIFAPDGGAGSIAGMNLNVTGANEVIFAFALWGGTQLIYALLQWLIILRYRSLVPLMWFVQLLETLGRMLVGKLKPVTFSHTPPGAYQNYIYIVLALSMLGFSLWSGGKATEKKSSASTTNRG
jgi:hypothetical protein